MQALTQDPTAALKEAVQQLDQEAEMGETSLDPQSVWQALDQLPTGSADAVPCLIRAGEILFSRGASAPAARLLEEALQRARAHNLTLPRVLALGLLAEIDRSLSLFREAFQHLHEALDLLPQLDDPAVRVHILMLAGLNDLSLGEYDLACQRFTEAHQIYSRLEQPGTLRQILTHLGQVSADMGNYPMAVHWLRESLAFAENIGDRIGMAQALSRLGEVQRLQANLEDSRRSFLAARDLYQEASLVKETIITENELGHVSAAMRNFAAALEHYQHAFSLAEPLDLSAQMVDTLAGLVVVLIATGQTARALETAGYLLRHPSFTVATESYFRPVLLPLLKDTGLPFTAGVEDRPIPHVIRETFAALQFVTQDAKQD